MLCRALVCLSLSVFFAVGAEAKEVSEILLPAMWQVKLDVQNAGTDQKWFAPDLNRGAIRCCISGANTAVCTLLDVPGRG